MIAAAVEHQQQLYFDVSEVSLHDLTSDKPWVQFTHDGAVQRIDCDYVAGCDGFHGVARESIPADALQNFERIYPYAWLGILADAAPTCDELVYAHHERGFALFSMRSPEVTRLYLQCRPDEDLAQSGPTSASGPSFTRASRTTKAGCPPSATSRKRA